MILNKKTSVKGAWARLVAYEYNGTKYEADIKDGDMLEIMNSGEEVEGQHGTQIVFSLRTRNGDRNKAFNQVTQNTLIEALGEDTAKWVGKVVKAYVIRAMVQGKLQNVAYFAPEGWEMDDEGKFKRTGGAPASTGVDPDTEVSPDDIPF
jgi:hypothetical protein